MKKKLLQPNVSVILQLLFWFLSIFCWNIVFNPGIESSASIKGLQDFWPELMLLYFVFYVMTLCPLIWLVKSVGKPVKVVVSILASLPLIYMILDLAGFFPEAGDEELIQDFFLSGYLYVIVFHLTLVVAVYYNLKRLVPDLLRKGKTGKYLLYFFALMLLAALLNDGLYDYCIDPLFPKYFFVSYFDVPELLVIVFLYMSTTTLVALAWHYFRELVHNRDRIRNELSALKAQINPHFLFNNLNTIYALASRNDDKVKEVILQLSDFLRYVLYDTAAPYIPLEKEVDMIGKYVALQLERINPETTKVSLESDGDFGEYRIAPLLLLPLAENCFKHGLCPTGGHIHLVMRLDNNHFLFCTENKVFRESTPQSDQS
ncbi:MAG: histidine kinase, partial [Marinilabiliales bacterium]|nr:histidine kinase [Marinilabiliales bacterium]